VASSVVDDLKSLEDRVISRIQELQPALRELEELRDIAKRLGIDPDAVMQTASGSHSPARAEGRSAATRAAGGRSRGATSRSRRNANAGAKRAKPVPRAKRAEQIVAAVNDRPGVTVAEIGAALGADPTSLYRVVHKLETDGTVRKEGRALWPGAAPPASP
jgi:DNA-binding MarR family transcriptional regulator